MKKMLFAVLSVGLMASSAYAGCLLGGMLCVDERGDFTIQGRVTGGTGEGIPSITAAQALTLVPKQAGQLVFCSDCAGGQDAVCVSTGTGTGAYVRISSATTYCR